MDDSALLKMAIVAALKGGEEILKIYETDFYIETKSDNTPVTLADKGSSKRILTELSGSGFPVISEEEEIGSYEVRKNWHYFWLVDPLDGTKEFIKRNGEFAVNVALIKNETPVIGVIYAPVIKDLYFSRTAYGSFKLPNAPAFVNSNPVDWFDKLLPASRKLPLQKPQKNYTVVASRSHLSREVNARIEKLKTLYGVVDVINVGSSIKQCWVAEGKAHEYPRFGTTMEWDTAAGQVILEESGKKLVDIETTLPLRYNKERMENNFFIAK
ncbi:MAG: 3'(2'),5'-bisphosphate nucleotidase CysQ [Bacteroidota bacterium]